MSQISQRQCISVNLYCIIVARYTPVGSDQMGIQLHQQLRSDSIGVYDYTLVLSSQALYSSLIKGVFDASIWGYTYYTSFSPPTPPL